MTNMNFIATTCAALNIDPFARGLQIADATQIAQHHFPHLDPDQHALVAHLNRAIASDCKLTLLVLYPPEHSVSFVSAAGKISAMQLAELDYAEQWAESQNDVTLHIPPIAIPSSFNALCETIARLRAPDGCPWDREQTHQSLRKDFLEECYEVLETLDEMDLAHLREELGDLMLHIVFQAQIASESSEFLMSEILAEVTAKLVRRHPHVFGDVQVNGTREIIENWDKIKATENGGKPKKKNSIPRTFPALVRAQKVAKHVGAKPTPKEIAANVEKLSRARDKEQALGEVLFALAAYAREKDIDAEGTLRKVANEKQKNLEGF